MKLRSKTFLVIGAVMLVMVIILVGFSSLVLEQSYSKLEDNEGRENVQRIMDSVENLEMQLDRSAADWAEWDATYQYVVDRNLEYESSNFESTVFENLAVNVIAVIDIYDSPVKVVFFDLEAQNKTAVPQQFLDHLVSGDPLIRDLDNRTGITGILNIDGRGLMVSSHPILTSLSEGPSRGHLIIGRYLDSEEISLIENQTGSKLTVYSANDPRLDSEMDGLNKASVMKGEIDLLIVNNSHAAAFATVNDIAGNPAIVIRSVISRDVYNQGQTTLGYLYTALIVIGLLFTMVSVLFIERFITSRVGRLDGDVAAIRDERSFSKRVRTNGKDELSTLSISINQMLDGLQASEMEVHKSEDRYRMVVEDQTDLIFRIDNGMNITFANRQFCTYFGKDAGQVIGSNSLLYISPDYRSSYVMNLQSLNSSRKVLTDEITVIDSKGHARTHRWTFRGISEKGNSGEVQIVGNDVTERKRAEEELRAYRENLEELVEQRTDELVTMNRTLESEIERRNEIERDLHSSEERHRELVDNQGEGIVLVDNSGKVTFSNPAADELVGVSSGKLVGTKIEDFTDEEGRKQAWVEKGVGMTRPRSTYRWKLVRPDGTRRTLLVTATPRMDNGGQFLGTFAIFRDVTDNDLMEQALRKREAEYRAVVEDQTDLIVRSLPDGTLTFVNGAFCRFFGRSAEDLVGRTFSYNIPEKEVTALTSIISGLKPNRPTGNWEIRLVRADGELRWMQSTFRGIFDSDGRMLEIQGVVRDVSEGIQMEQERVRGQRLESIGTLAGGIAHDFNNILTSIIGNVSLIKMRLGPGDPLMVRLTETETEIIRAKKLTDKLLTFSKGGEPIKEVQDIKDVIPEAVTAGLLGTSIRSRVDYAPGLALVEIDKGQVIQSLSNLIRNAGEASGGEGEISISVANLAFEQDRNGRPNGTYVSVSVIDHGPGIPPENMAKLFDPYFSTKGEGKGMGLSTALSIAKRHGGWIDVETGPESGTTFILILPSAKKGSEGEAVMEESPVGSRVLLMDDEEAILEVGKELLEAHGFIVETAKDGRQAIDLYIKADKSGNGIDVVIMDLTIHGGMGGKEAIGELLKYDPKAVAIVSSGYSNDPVMAEYRKFGFSAVVQKPYMIRDMVETIRSVMKNNRKAFSGENEDVHCPV